MKKVEIEAMLLCGACVLAPLIGGLVALPLFLGKTGVIFPIIIGTIAGMAFYMGVGWLNGSLSGGEEDSHIENPTPKTNASQDAEGPESISGGGPP